MLHMQYTLSMNFLEKIKSVVREQVRSVGDDLSNKIDGNKRTGPQGVTLSETIKATASAALVGGLVSAANVEKAPVPEKVEFRTMLAENAQYLKPELTNILYDAYATIKADRDKIKDMNDNANALQEQLLKKYHAGMKQTPEVSPLIEKVRMDYEGFMNASSAAVTNLNNMTKSPNFTATEIGLELTNVRIWKNEILTSLEKLLAFFENYDDKSTSA